MTSNKIGFILIESSTKISKKMKMWGNKGKEILL